MNVLALENELDAEWTELIIEALNLGIPVNDIREFLNKANRPD